MPKNIEIYLEIPNCFKNFLLNYDILNSFNITKIDLSKIPDLKLSERKLNAFKKMKGFNNIEEIRKFIEKNIGFDIYSYHQINIFINLFTSQYNKFDSNIKFLENGIDVTEKCIKAFSEATKYFTFGSYSQLLTENKLEKEESLNSMEKY